MKFWYLFVVLVNSWVTHGDGSGEHLYAANIITFFRISKFSVEKMLIGTVPPILSHLQC